jgi:hypothetical protein
LIASIGQPGHSTSPRTDANAIGIPNEKAMPRNACGSAKKRLKNG